MKAGRRGSRPGSPEPDGRAAEKLGVYLAASEPSARAGPGAGRGVLPDTCVWIDFFRSRGTALGQSLERALRTEEVFTCGQVLSELLQGVVSAQDRASVLQALGTLEYAEMEPRVWMRAAEIAAGLRARGKTVPHSDLLIAAVSMDRGLQLLTGDRHFQEIPGVEFFEG